MYIFRLTFSDKTLKTFCNCSSLGLPSPLGSLAGLLAGTFVPWQYATALCSKSDKQVGSIV